MRRLTWVVVLAGLFAIAGCRSGNNGMEGPTTTFGLPCDDVSQCREDAPTCVEITAADYGPGICAYECPVPAGCPGGSECRAGFCIQCHASLAGTVEPGGECGCDADCSAGTCVAGVCAVDCTATPCAAGYSCDGNPPLCRECLGNDTPSDEGGPCSCDMDCAARLSCIGAVCARACDFDEMCGADECRHEALVGASCQVVDPACTGAGTGAPGDPCACNADCSTDAPICVGAFVGGERVGHCGNICGPMMNCAAGTRCCTVVPSLPYCLTDDVITSTSATCL